jgi:sugar lactone lactonase YvrE
MTVQTPSEPSARELEIEAGVIEDARRRQRRSRLVWSAVIAVALGIGLVLGFSGSGGGSGVGRARNDHGSSAGSASSPKARFAESSAGGLIRPGALALTANGSLLIADTGRNQVFRRLPTGRLQVLAGTGATGFAGDGGPATDAEFDNIEGIVAAPNGNVYVADTGNGRVREISPNGTIRTLVAYLQQPSGIVLAKGGTLYVATETRIVTISPRGIVHVLLSGHGRLDQIRIATQEYGAFYPQWLALDGAGDVYVFSFAGKEVFEFSPTGVGLNVWVSYAEGLARAPDGSVVVAAHGAGLARIRNGRLSMLVSFIKTAPVGYPTTKAGAFDPAGVAVAPNGSIYTDTDLGDGYTDETALAKSTPTGHTKLLKIITPVADTLPAFDARGFPATIYPRPVPAAPRSELTACPSPAGLRTFNGDARAAAADTARLIDTGFYDGLRRSDRAWWSGFYADQVGDGYAIGIGSHVVGRIGPAIGDIYAQAVSHACGAKLLASSLAITVHGPAYSDEVSHLYFVDRDGHALLYWQRA